MQVSEAAAKAKLSDMPQEVLLGVEERLGLTVETVWPARCGLAGFLICFGLAISQPPGSTNNAIFHAMLALAGLGLGRLYILYIYTHTHTRTYIRIHTYITHTHTNTLAVCLDEQCLRGSD